MKRDQNLLRRMHEPLQRYPEQSPVLTTLLRAFSAGLESIDLRAMQRAMYLGTARGKWLTEWADLYAYERGTLTDAELYAQMQAQTILERRKTTREAIETALQKEAGVSVLIFDSAPRTYRFDEVHRLMENDFAFDYSALVDGKEEATQVDWYHRGSGALLVASREWGASGLWIVVRASYDADLEEKITRVLERRLKAGANFTLGWQARIEVDISDMLEIDDEVNKPDYGWGIDPFGPSTWG